MLVVPDHRDHINTSATAFNRNLTALGYSTIEPMAYHHSTGDAVLHGSIGAGHMYRQNDEIHMEIGPEIRGNSGRDQFGYSALFGPNDFQPQQIRENQISNRQNNSRVNFRDRYEPGGPMSTVRHGIDERQREGDDTRDNSRQHGGLKSSMKYAKPPCLQNTSAFALSMTGRNNTTGGIIGTNKSVHMHGDHDDLKLKLDKLSTTFLEKNKGKDAFKDTFFDEEIFGEELRARNYFKLSLDLLKYALHSANQPKKKKDDKKAGASSFGGLKR